MPTPGNPAALRARRRFVFGIAAAALLACAGAEVARAHTFATPTARAAAQPLSAVERFDAPPVDIVAVQADDAARERAGEPPRYAVPNAVRIDPQNAGTWERLAGGDLLWRLRIDAPGALSLNLGFTQYRLPKGARLCLYPAGNDSSAVAFDERDNEEHGQLWTPVVLGDEAVVELTLPAESVGDYRLELTSVNVGYRFFGEKPAGKSGSCNIDVVCPEGDLWGAEIPSVGVISTGGTTFCSGFLVNDTAQDRRPFFQTANHCGITQSAAPSLVVYWNFQSPTCGQHGGGSLSQFQTGSIFRAASAATADFTLVELDDPVDPAFALSWAGWDRGQQDPTRTTVIHHPSTDEKSISFDNDPATTTSYYGTAVPGDGTHLRVADYELGTTEPGSSGSPLFDQNHRVVGQLHGGDAACGNDLSDWYGRFSISWTGGGTAGSRLSSWLDAGGSGATSVNTLAPWYSNIVVMPTQPQTNAGNHGGPFVPGSVLYTVHNGSGSAISYAVTENIPWLSLTGATGVIPAGGDALVTATISPYATQIGGGLFTGQLSFANLTTHRGDCTRTVRLQVGQPILAYSWPLDTNPGWTAEGQWAFGHPTGGSGDHGGPDPTAGHTGQNVYGYNLAGGYPSNMSQLNLTTTAIDCGGLSGTTLKFWRWLGVEQSAYDHASVQVSNDGAAWTTVWENTVTLAETSWQPVSLDISAVADGRPAVYVRWTMGPTDASWTYCGWNVDDVEIWGLRQQATGVAASGPQPPVLLREISPNPFNPRVAIHFALGQAGTARLAVYDARGRLVRTLIAAELPAGAHEASWDGRDAAGRAAASGTYLCRLEAAGGQVERKMTLVR